MSDRMCLEDGCDRLVGKKGARGRCSPCMHKYVRWFERRGLPVPPGPRQLAIDARGGKVSDLRRPARPPRYCIECGKEVEYSGSRGRCGSCAYRWRKSFTDRGLPIPPREQNVDARYPPREQLVALMAELGSFNRLAAAVGVHRGSLQTYLRLRPDLYAELDALRKPLRGTPRNPDSGEPWHSQALSTTRLRYSSGYYAIDLVARDYTAVLRGDPCSYCGRPTTTIDHIEPLGRGGDDLYTNLTGACHWCNSSKNDTPLLLWMLATIDRRAARTPTAGAGQPPSI